VAGILERLGTTAEAWQARLKKLSEGRFFDRFFTASRQRLREVADRLGLRRVPNPGRMPGDLTPIASRFGHRVEIPCAAGR